MGPLSPVFILENKTCSRPLKDCMQKCLYFATTQLPRQQAISKLSDSITNGFSDRPQVADQLVSIQY